MSITDERNDCKDNIIKHLQCLTIHKHSTYKLIHNSENIPGLPVSHNYHRYYFLFIITNHFLNWIFLGKQ